MQQDSKHLTPFSCTYTSSIPELILNLRISLTKLAIPNKEQQAVVIAFNLPTRAIAGNLTFHASVDEIYDVKVLPKYIHPNILNIQSEINKHGVDIPEMTFWARGHNKS